MPLALPDNSENCSVFFIAQAERGRKRKSRKMKRIPRIKFPQRRPKSSPSASASQTQATSTDGDTHQISISRSDVPAAPTSTAVGGKASLQPKRTPVSDKEIEAILLGGCF